MKITLVTTPIGNISDITDRARASLISSDLILCEDTRVTKSLAQMLGIELSAELISFNDHSSDKIAFILKKIKSKAQTVLVSDAGSPCISDPAYPLIKACLEQGIEIDSNPGPSAMVMALELSGLPTTPFSFHGFLARSKGEIQKSISEHDSIGGTHIYFESPHRIIQTLEVFKSLVPHCEIAICRELTKKFQSVYRDKLSELKLDSIEVKGEFVIVIHYGQKKMAVSSELEELAKKVMTKANDKNLSKLLSSITGEKAKIIYESLTKNRRN